MICMPKHPRGGLCSPGSLQPVIRSTLREQTEMSNHELRSNKEPKKQPLHTAKEKRAAKRAKKHADDHPPPLVKKP